MTKIAYLDCLTGIAGDMCLGALVSAGVPLYYLRDQLATLGIKQEFTLETEQIQHQGQAALKLHVQLQESGHGPDHGPDHGPGHGPGQAHAPMPHRGLSEIRGLIERSPLPTGVKASSLRVFERLAQAEAAVHGCELEAVHFHEVGATDAIVDIVGTCLGFDWLGIEQVYCSALPVGGGTVWAAHGRLPVPAPAVLKLFELGQVPIYSNGIERELVTPTGAAIATVLAGDRFGPPPALRLQTVGLGAGTAVLKLPNILRLWVGELGSGSPQALSTATANDAPTSRDAPPGRSSQIETITLLETQLDDLSPQAIGYVFERLLAAGALDVFMGAIAMKKNRPGTLLSVICQPEQADELEAILFRETTTLGIRRQTQQRRALSRRHETVKTPYGPVRIKLAWTDDPDAPTNIYPEYEDCARLARESQQPWQTLHRLALEAYHGSDHGSGLAHRHHA